MLSASRPGLIFREVVRKPTEYWVRFSARAGSRPVVYYGTQPPVRSSNSGLLGIPGAIQLPVRLVSERGFAAEYSTAPMKSLPQGTKYYFVIIVPEAPNVKPESYGGEFLTMTQTVVVRFTQIRILNDSDKESSGDLSFKLQLAPPPKNTPDCVRPDDCVNRIEGKPWETGTSHPLANVLRMDAAPARVRVWVTGWDDDTSDDAFTFGPGPVAALYSGTGGTNNTVDWNTAKAEFNVGAYPDRARIGIPFKLRSIDGHVLMFEVVGEIEVTRQ